MAKNTGNNGKGNNPLRDGWQTPQQLFDELNKQYKFNFDCCASEYNKKCKLFSSKFETDIIEPADLRIANYICWMNPPFSIAWKMFETFFSIVTKGVAIYRCDNFETGLWQRVIFPNCDWIFIPDKRISYEGIDGDGARFPSALIGVGCDIPKNLSGTILIVKKQEGGNSSQP